MHVISVDDFDIDLMETEANNFGMPGRDSFLLINNNKFWRIRQEKSPTLLAPGSIHHVGVDYSSIAVIVAVPAPPVDNV